MSTERASMRGVALVTGAASGIGQITAFVFAERGCRGVVFADRNFDGTTVDNIHVLGVQAVAKESESYATHPDYKSLAIKVDVADMQSVQAMVDQTVQTSGQIDYLVNSAGISPHRIPLTSLSSPEHLVTLSQTIDINQKGTIHCLSAVITQMLTQPFRTSTPILATDSNPNTNPNSLPRALRPRTARPLGRGAIVNLGSGYSFFAGVPGQKIPYVSTKYAIVGITKSAAFDYGKQEIRVNAVCPGTVETPLFKGLLENSPEMRKGIEARVLLGNEAGEGRMATCEEVADMIVWLCGDEASYVTGCSHLIDGGLLLH